MNLFYIKLYYFQSKFYDWKMDLMTDKNELTMTSILVS